MMKTRLQLAIFIVHFGLVFVYPSNENGYQFWGLPTPNAKNNLEEKHISIKTLQNEVSQSQHVFDAMKNELQRAQNTNIQKRNVDGRSNTFQKNVIRKREMDNRSYNPKFRRPIDRRRYDHSSSSEQSDYYDDDDDDDTSLTLIRLNRFISNAGVCARREADRLIESGRITVDGKVVRSMGTKVAIDAKVRYNGKLLRAEKLKYILLNKPKGFVSTLYDPEGRRTVLDLIPRRDCPERIYPVGRLDYDTRGLLLLTNDGELARNLSHPANEVQKFYHAVLDKPLTVEDANTIRQGVLLDDGVAHVDRVTVLEADRTNVGVTVHMGKNRIIRRILNRLGYVVESLDRVGYAHLTKQYVPRGKWIHLSDRDIKKLKALAKKTE